MTAIKVAASIGAASVVPAVELLATTRKARGIRHVAINPPRVSVLMFLRPIPAMKNTRTPKQISLADMRIAAAPNMLNVSFTKDEQQEI